MKAAVIGAGYWGPNLIRNFLGNKLIEKVFACDFNKQRLEFQLSHFILIFLTKTCSKPYVQ